MFLNSFHIGVGKDGACSIVEDRKDRKDNKWYATKNIKDNNRRFIGHCDGVVSTVLYVV
jgi:hypothetical protein